MCSLLYLSRLEMFPINETVVTFHITVVNEFISREIQPESSQPIAQIRRFPHEYDGKGRREPNAVFLHINPSCAFWKNIKKFSDRMIHVMHLIEDNDNQVPLATPRPFPPVRLGGKYQPS